LGKFFPPFAGGMEHFLADLLTQQQQQGLVARALVHDHRWPWQVKSADHLAVQRVPCLGRLLYAPISPQFPWYLQREIEHYNPDILHLHLPNTSAFWAMALPSARRLPWVVHWHSDVVSSTLDKRLSLAYPLYRPLEQALLRHSAAIIVTSPPYLAASAALRQWQDKCQVVPLGLTQPKTVQRDAQWTAQQWQANKLRLLSVGRLTYYKGHAQLLDVIKPLKNVQLLIVGAGEKRKALQQQIEQNQQQNQVRLLGYCEAEPLAALWQSCEVFCLPSLERTEAFGVVLLEAMAYQKPVIASEIVGSGVTWVVKHGQTGFLVPLFAHDLWQEAIEQLQNLALRARMGLAAQQRFSENFALPAVAAQIESLYATLS
jgi:rhamnosyl/mannosyltransferase